MLDQMTNGQLEWEPLENPFDHVVLGPLENRRRYPIYSGRSRFTEELKKCFPGEKKAIDEFIKLIKVGSQFSLCIWELEYNDFYQTDYIYDYFGIISFSILIFYVNL